MPGARANPCAAAASTAGGAPDNRRRRRPRRLAAALALALAGVALGAVDARAHIQVTPTLAAPDDAVLFTVLVPNERSVATTAVDLKIPAGLLPFSFEATPGWQRRTIEGPDGAVERVRWTGRLPRGAFVRFSFLASTPSKAGPIAWKALQRYADGQTVRWIGSETSETPAAVTEVSASAPKQNAGGESGSAASGAAPSDAAAVAARDEDDDGGALSLIVAGVALLLALAALALGLIRRGGASA